MSFVRVAIPLVEKKEVALLAATLLHHEWRRISRCEKAKQRPAPKRILP